MSEVDILPDWMTTPKIKLGTKITSDNSDRGIHMHSFYEIFYIIEGTVKHVANGKVELLSPGDVIFLRLSDIHYFDREENSKCKHRDIVVSCDQYEKCCNFINDSLLNYIKSSTQPPKIKLSLDEINILEQKFNDFINVPLDDTNTKASMANVLLTDILGRFIYSRQMVLPAKYPAWFEQILSRFNMNLYIKSGLKEIIKPFHYNQSYICRAFKKYMGTTMSHYLCIARLEYAALLLKTTDKTITEIANDVGFSSVSFFNKQFKLHYKLPPKEYKKLIKIHG